MFAFEEAPTKGVAIAPTSDDPFNYAIAQDWSKPFAERVRTAAHYRRWDEAHLATIEAVIRRLVRRGWVRRRTSIHKERASSRYLRPEHDCTYEIRISNHTLRRGRSWNNDYVITDKIIQTYTVARIIEWIEMDYRQYRIRLVADLRSRHVVSQPG